MLFSCTKDDLENNATNSITNQLKSDLKLDQFANKNISGNLVVNWEAFSKIEKEDFEIYEIEAHEKKPSTIESNLFQSELKYELIAIKNGNEVHSYLIEAYSNLKHGLFPNSIQSLKNFTGTLTVFELSGKQIGQLVIINGNANTPSNDSSLDPLANAINLFYESKKTTNRLPACNQITTVPVVHEEWIDYFNVWTTASGAYIGTFFMSTTYSSYITYMSVAYDCDQPGDSYHILQRTSTYRDVVVNVSDPCQTASITTALSKDSNYISAKTSIQTAATDGFEHSITLGKDANGVITQAPMNSGNQQYMVSTNYSWAGAIAALHNHPNNTPLSAGDIYASVQLNEKSSNFATTFVLTNGETYGIVVTNLALAQAFVTNFPADQLPNQSPEFPTVIFNQIENLKSDMGYGIEGRTTAMAFILDKYSAGITLLKQDSSGNFSPIKTEETIQNGVKTYTPKPCN